MLPRRRGVDDALRATSGRPLRARLDEILAVLVKRSQPALLLFDTFEQGGDWARWVEDYALLATPRAPPFSPGRLNALIRPLVDECPIFKLCMALCRGRVQTLYDFSEKRWVSLRFI